eukprot:PhF_6_TR8781/c0_g1_i4/m.13914
MPLIILSCESEEGIVMTESYEGLLQAATDAYGSTITPGMQLILTYTYMGHTVTIRSQQHFDAFVRMSNLSEPLRCVVQQRKPLKISTVTDDVWRIVHAHLPQQRKVETDVLDARELRSTLETLGSMTPRFNEEKEKPTTTVKAVIPSSQPPLSSEGASTDEMLFRIRQRQQELQL